MADEERKRLRRLPTIRPESSTRHDRQLQLVAVRQQITDLRRQLQLAQAEERFLRLHLEVFPTDEVVPLPPEAESGVESDVESFESFESESLESESESLLESESLDESDSDSGEPGRVR